MNSSVILGNITVFFNSELIAEVTKEEADFIVGKYEGIELVEEEKPKEKLKEVSKETGKNLTEKELELKEQKSQLEKLDKPALLEIISKISTIGQDIIKKAKKKEDLVALILSEAAKESNA